MSILKQRAEAISQSRRDDDDSDLALVYGSPPEPPAEEELDELGRIVPRANPAALRKERRAARVARRHRRQLRKGVSEVDDRDEGYSTDSSLPPSDDQDYRTVIERITSGGEDILSDVQVVEFKDPNLGLAKWFGEWRDRYGDSYTGAWGGLGLIGAWEFWVRLELLGWNPLEVSCAIFWSGPHSFYCSRPKPLTSSLGTRPSTNILNHKTTMRKWNRSRLQTAIWSRP